MPRPLAVLVALMGLGALGILGYSFLVRPPISPRVSTDGAPSTPRIVAGPQQVISAAVSATSASQIPDANAVAKWMADATGDEPEARAVAITALAAAPPLQALPVLRAVLSAGDPVDRRLALQSLRAIALDTGDADGSIRSILRQAIYHGDNEAVVQETQTTLDDVEGYLDQAAVRSDSGTSASGAAAGPGF